MQLLGCGGYSFGMSGRIQSPNYPEAYPSHMYCVYNLMLYKPQDLSIHKTHGIRLIFDVFNVENIAHRDDCSFDGVHIYEHYHNEKDKGKLLGRLANCSKNGTVFNNQLTTFSFCGVRTPPPILSIDSTMAIVFMSDRSVSGTG